MNTRIQATLFAALLPYLVATPLRGQSQPGANQAEAKKLTLKDLFPSDRVLDVQITLDPADWKTVRRQIRDMFSALDAKRKNGPIESPYTYFRAKVVIDGVEFSDVGLRKKGFIGSQDFTYPSFKVKLNYVDKQGGIEGLTNLTFNNNKQDKNLVNQFMGYAFFNAAGSPAPRCAYAKVTVNGKELGIYSHVESVRKQLFEYRFGNSSGTLYEATVVDFYEGWEQSFEHKFGPDRVGREKILELTQALHNDEDQLRAIGEVVDLDSFYKFWAVEGLLGVWDGYSGNANNYFVYLNPTTGKFHFLPWGADSLFMKFSMLQPDRRAPRSVKTKGLLAHRLYQIPAARKRYEEALRDLLDEHWDENALLAEMDRIEEMLEPHIIRRQRGFYRALEMARDFVSVREEELLEEIKEGMPLWNRAPDRPVVLGGSDVSLVDAAVKGNTGALEQHISEGADLDERDSESGATALIAAATFGQTSTALILINGGADLELTNNEGSTALGVAAFLCREEIVEALLAKGADKNARNKDGATALEAVAGPFDEVKPIYDLLRSALAPLGVKLDYERIKSTRPKIAEMLREK